MNGSSEAGSRGSHSEQQNVYASKIEEDNLRAEKDG